MTEILKFFQDNGIGCDLHLLTKGSYTITIYGMSQFPICEEFPSLDAMEQKLQYEIENWVK